VNKILSFLFGFFVFVTVVVLVALYNYSKDLKFSTEKLTNYHPELTTQIFDKNGDLIANIFKKEHRLYAPYRDIPPRLIEAVVAIEDTAFFEHNGVNPEAILRAVIKAIKYGRPKEGASTLTQQLIKNTILTPEKTLKRKLNEALLALKLETELSKEEILERYLNEIFYGHGYHGVKTASLGYFHKELNELNLKEIAMLAGLPKAPSTYDPTKHLNNCLSRANTVLARMKALGWITEKEYKKYVDFVPKVYNSKLSKNRYPYIVDEVLRELKKEYPDIKYGGYKIYTTVEPALQDLAKESLIIGYKGILARYLSKLKRRAVPKSKMVDYTDLNGAMVVLDNKTGNILALVGGVEYEKSKYNRAIQSKRQPGSAIKPFIYLTALDYGYSPQSKLVDMSRSFKYGKKVWNPKNYEKNFEGLISLRDALVHSRNLATINLVRELGLNSVYNSLKKMGFEGIQKNLSISLGTFGISPLEFAGKYTIFSNYGIMLKPKLTQKIVDKDGNVRVFEPIESNITKPKQAFLMTTILEDVVKRGTARKAKVEGIETAGKTGTTNEYKDAWFCGYTPEITVITWFGKDNNKPMYKETGGKAAAPSFANFVKGYIKLHPETKRKFDIPEGVRVVKFQGKDEYFTDISQPPNDSVESESDVLEEELLF
jgi:penicillin-binding protein 1A